MVEGIDYSFARPGGAAIAAAGKAFAVRYLGQGGKGLDPAELADLRAHGIAVPLVYESSGTTYTGGRAQGRADATAAEAARNALGLGPQPIYFAVDTNAGPSQYGLIDEYLQGCGEILGSGRVGLYAGIGPIQHVQGSGTATWFWQTYAWSGGRVASGIHLYQYLNGQQINGGSVDFCRSMTADYGQNYAIQEETDMGIYGIYQRTDSGVTTYAIGILDPNWRTPGHNFWWEGPAANWRDVTDYFCAPGQSPKPLPNDTWDSRSNDPNRISDITKFPAPGGATVTLDANAAQVLADALAPALAGVATEKGVEAAISAGVESVVASIQAITLVVK